MTSKKPKEIRPVKMETFKITHLHRRKLKYYLDKFYRCYPNEKWTVLQFVKFFKERLKNNKDAWMGVSGDTGCQPAKSKVLMADGSFKNIEEIKIGDEVLSPQEDGGYLISTVLKTYEWKSKENYKIIEATRKNRELFRCSHNHELPVYRFNGRKGKFYLKYYTAKGYNKLSDSTLPHMINLSAYPIPGFKGIKNCEIEPYSLGVFIGDGMFCKYCSHVLNITTADVCIINEVKKHYKIMSIKDKYILGLKRNSKARSYNFSSNEKLSKQLKSHGYLNKKSGDKFICESALKSDLNYRRKLLAGLLDSDGSQSSIGQYDYITKSKQLAEDIFFLVHSVGGRTSISKCIKGIKKYDFKGTYYRLYIIIRNLNMPMKKHIEKKNNKTRGTMPNRYTIKSIRTKGTRVYGFTLDSPSSWYLNENMIILKNTGKSLLALTCMILFGRPMNLNNNVTYLPSGEEIVDKFNKLSFNCLLIDEAAKDLRSINWQKKSQQSVTTKAQTDRFKNNWLFLNLPNFNEFTKSLRTTSIQFRAIVLYRTNKYARIVIHRKSRNWRDEDPWKDKIANDLYKKIEKNHELDNRTMIDIERRLPNTVMDFIIPNLELILPEITTEYERLKILSRTIEEDVGRTAPLFNMYKAKYENVMAIITKTLVYNELHIGKINVTKTEIAKKLGISTSTLRNYLDMDTRVFEKTRGIVSEEEGKKE